MPKRSGIQSLYSLVNADSASVPEVLRARAELTPDATFLWHEHRCWSFAEALELSRRFAGFLNEIEPDAKDLRVASFLPNRPEAIWSWFGCNLLDGVFVSINRDHRGSVLKDQLVRSGARILLAERGVDDAASLFQDTSIRHVVYVDSATDSSDASTIRAYDLEEALGAPSTESVTPRPDSAASLVFTSGTTGRSKACLIPHNQLCRGAGQVVDAMHLRPDDVVHDWLPLAHIASQIHMAMAALVSGARLAKFPRFSRSRFWDQVRTVGATVFSGQGTIGQMLLSEPERDDDCENSLRLGVLSAIPRLQRLQFERRFGVRVFDFYGMTEAEPVTVALPGPDRPPGCVGRATNDFEVAIFDELDRPVPPGTTGLIVLRPRVPSVMMVGYEGNDGIVAKPLHDSWFHTRDLGYLDDEGSLFFVEREKHSIRRGGENVSSGEVEAILLEHPDVVHCAVVGVDSALFGQEIKGVIVKRSDSDLSFESLHEWCKDKMATFMTPRYLEFRDRIPYTSFGKPEYDKLRVPVGPVWDAHAQGRPFSSSGEAV